MSTGDLLLLCSDGLTRGVRCSEMLRTLEQDGDLGEKTDRLIALANDAEERTTSQSAGRRRRRCGRSPLAPHRNVGFESVLTSQEHA